MQGLVVGRYIFTDTSKREGGGALFFRVTAKQGHKMSFLKILNHTSPPRAVARRTKQGGCECKICRQKIFSGENYF